MKGSLSKITRKEKIIEILKYNSKISKKELIRRLKVSPMTLERDIKELEEEGIIYKIWGGIALREEFPIPPFEERETLNLQEKQSIANEAIKLISPGESIGLSAGTTVYEFAKLIPSKSNIKVVTYAVNTASLLISKGIEVIMPGGICKDGTYALVGDIAVNFFKSVHLDKCFISINGITLENGLSEIDIQEAILLSAMLKVSSEVIVLADHTKFGRQKLTFVCGIEDVDTIVTDRETPQYYIQALREKGIKVLIGE